MTKARPADDPSAAPRSNAPPDPARKVLSRSETVERFGRPRRERVVFTNGCFDILHRGHVAYLHEARALGDRLVVGINTDASVQRLKGPGRPVVPQDDRAFVLAGLACVDAVTLFDEDTPAELINALVPDVLVKGGDYAPDAVVGRETVEAAGGRLVLIPFVSGRSTTTILHRIRESDS
ncbi:MAG TPA: D-glycero-beta-D-manno-heptose 1-phosphate adenylyltransferase [Longimicrobiales bacterium]|nr:D-glycero-beta-D-manno-heptose 1-phosphate adenylyltransferase [Longimicrobiales bacterium]